MVRQGFAWAECHTPDCDYHDELLALQDLAQAEALGGWLEKQVPSAAASLRGGLEERFTINHLEMPASLRRCLGTTNLIESANAGMSRHPQMPQRTGRVTRWQDGAMVLRRFAAGYLETEKHFRRIMGYEQLWRLKAKRQEIAELRLERLRNAPPVSDGCAAPLTQEVA